MTRKKIVKRKKPLVHEYTFMGNITLSVFYNWTESHSGVSYVEIDYVEDENGRDVEIDDIYIAANKDQYYSLESLIVEDIENA